MALAGKGQLMLNAKKNKASLDQQRQKMLLTACCCTVDLTQHHTEDELAMSGLHVKNYDLDQSITIFKNTSAKHW